MTSERTPAARHACGVFTSRLLETISYAPDFATPTISGAEATAWLQFVLPRVDDGAAPS